MSDQTAPSGPVTLTTGERRYALPPWTHLHGEDAYALTVPDTADAIDGLVEMVDYHDGWTASRDNPVIIEAAKHARVEQWRSCTKAWRESEGVGDEYGSDYFSPNGDGRRWVRVVWWDGDIFDLSDEARRAASNNGGSGG